jgi:hypothetical protein
MPPNSASAAFQFVRFLLLRNPPTRKDTDMKSFLKTFAILFCPVFIFALSYAPANSVGRQMVKATMGPSPAEIAALQAAYAVKVEEIVAYTFMATTRPVMRPGQVVMASPRPEARPDPLAAYAAQLRIAIATTPNSSISLPPKSKAGLSQEDCLAVANYHEARGEGLRGQIAVSSVILKRAAVPGRWGRNACEVVRPVMFAFMTGEHSFPPILDFEAWKVAKVIARHALAKGPLPELRHADHYHANSVSPNWRTKMPITAVVGQHIFYADPLSRG